MDQEPNSSKVDKKCKSCFNKTHTETSVEIYNVKYTQEVL